MASLKTRVPTWLDRLQPSETAVLFGTAILVGAGTSLGAVFFIRLIEILEHFFFRTLELSVGVSIRWLIIFIPMVGGLLAGPIIAFFAREAKGHGVPEVMQSIALSGGRIRPRVVVAKIAASALCLGSGGSAGREGPIVQVGAALGSTLGQWLHLSESRIRNLVASGAAAGIAATFNAPIAGVLFAMEIILGELHLGEMGNVVISAVTASTVARIFLGERPAFNIPRYGIQKPWEILLFALLGLLSALVAVFFIRMLYWFEDLFDGWHFPMALKPAIGGLLLGGLAFAYPLALGPGIIPIEETGPLVKNVPYIFGAGFPVIEAGLLGNLAIGLLVVLVLLKPLATSLTLGSGNSGGVFAPSLFTGAALGGAFGQLVERFMPGPTSEIGAFAVVGMAAVFAGAARAPFTAILIVFEMTDDYQLIVPLMAAVIVSLVISERLHKESIYTLKLSRRGIRLRSGRDVDVMEVVKVGEVMVRQPVTVPVDMPVSLLANEFIRTGRHGFPVLNPDGSLFGVVSLEDYRRATAGEHMPQEGTSVRDIATTELVTVSPEDTVGTALRHMAPRDLSRLLVVAKEDPSRLLGVVRRNDIVRAYEVGALRREEARRRAGVTQSVNEASAEFIDVPVLPGSAAEGVCVKDLRLPREAVLVSIRRGSKLVIPHGDTKIIAGDVVTALCERNCSLSVQEEFERQAARTLPPEPGVTSAGDGQLKVEEEEESL